MPQRWRGWVTRRPRQAEFRATANSIWRCPPVNFTFWFIIKVGHHDACEKIHKGEEPFDWRHLLQGCVTAPATPACSSVCYTCRPTDVRRRGPPCNFCSARGLPCPRWHVRYVTPAHPAANNNKNERVLSCYSIGQGPNHTHDTPAAATQVLEMRLISRRSLSCRAPRGTCLPICLSPWGWGHSRKEETAFSLLFSCLFIPSRRRGLRGRG